MPRNQLLASISQQTGPSGGTHAFNPTSHLTPQPKTRLAQGSCSLCPPLLGGSNAFSPISALPLFCNIFYPPPQHPSHLLSLCRRSMTPPGSRSEVPKTLHVPMANSLPGSPSVAGVMSQPGEQHPMQHKKCFSCTAFAVTLDPSAASTPAT